MIAERPASQAARIRAVFVQAMVMLGLLQIPRQRIIPEPEKSKPPDIRLPCLQIENQMLRMS